MRGTALGSSIGGPAPVGGRRSGDPGRQCVATAPPERKPPL